VYLCHDAGVERRELDARGLTFSVREAGPPDGEPVLLLHGFPETSHMWIGLMEALAENGYRCLAPDMRGYSSGARPEGADNYHYEELVADVFAMADAAGFDRFHLIGHDWGAIVGWAVVCTDDSRIASWSALSVPHYRSFAEAVRDDPEEEFYRGLLVNFVGPDMAPALSANGAEPMRVFWTSSAPDEIDDYISVFAQPGALQAALNYYVACAKHARALDGPVTFGTVSTPTLFLWGKDDVAIRPMSVDGAAKYMSGPYRRVDLEAGHWLVQEQPEQVRDEILAHLKEHAL
jgi:pimeloyl-ACP methyl ester carboxylesterase